MKLTKDRFCELALILFIATFISLIGNCINTITDGDPDTFVSVLSGIPGMLILFCIAFAGLLLGELIPKVPSVIWITIIGILVAMPFNKVTGPIVTEQVAKIGLLPAATPILAYAGVSIGKDWIEFKKIGWRGILVALIVLIGTYLGSALIAQGILKMQGII